MKEPGLERERPQDWLVPLAGRRDEVKALSAALCGRKSCLVAGPAGIGKTRLIQEALQEALCAGGIGPGHVSDRMLETLGVTLRTTEMELHLEDPKVARCAYRKDLRSQLGAVELADADGARRWRRVAALPSQGGGPGFLRTFPGWRRNGKALRTPPCWRSKRNPRADWTVWSQLSRSRWHRPGDKPRRFGRIPSF